MHDALSKVKLSEDKLHHRRAHDSYAAVSRGLSHGGGQTEPGELQQNVTNTRVTNELLVNEFINRFVGFTTLLLFMWAPKLAKLYHETKVAFQARMPDLQWNFARSPFAACTFNFGPRVVTRPHLDHANLAWGWCAITALGWFNADLGGHLILWDLRLVIRFPAGSTIFIPSAIIRHSNVPVQSHEIRSSFTQYTAGGLFRWARNGFRSNQDFEDTATDEEKAAREAEDSTRWEDGINMFSIIDEL
ncbi:hypothetical protein MSAN_01888800 [Mycena sanguinolenta]|uniref:Uncharacterized protein n=1 Tax=Mycena sanguinolenta TaxID=230812 RepID=A0A8H6XPK6_9AGAR|nr:hypothetical protein MSAN_01888800 [Mycena sanguinolenta]